ncbi:chloride channel CLIC-like protein 1 isoform X2 [Acanthochromis polyacanthus]|uniref:chloride channel CLIC-like protein 1 isoform X2 n=1 Tax=Acanthochromis polyacanthus TaxID=80966 RepID=UPI002234BFF4|nr:chloride channel CLIC-like protein 1 isoform X2 [Acanthochromis polyacanthus]
MLFIVLVWSLLVSTAGQQVDDEWLDPYDMLNYDPGTQKMRKPAEPAIYSNVATRRREYIQEEAEVSSCNKKVVDLQKQIEDQKKTITLMSQQPTCNPVFKRFLSRLLKNIQRVGEPSDSSDVFYDAKIKLSRQAMTEIQTLLEGEDRWRTGALDNAISQLLVDLKPHDYEAWKWRFEDTFGVELDTVLKIGMGFLIIVALICTELWSRISWFTQFIRLLMICFPVSVIWNWFYLYKIAFAEHQNNVVKMDSFNDKCTGVKRIDWTDSLTEWYRSTWTLQDDPCKRYYEVLMVNPILLVPPTKAIAVTVTTFITEPLKHIGQGISEFLRALLKDLPVTLQIPVLFVIVIAVVVCMYGSVQAAFQYGIMAPLRRPRRDPPPPPELEPRQPQQPRYLRNEDRDELAGGDAPGPEAAPRPAARPAPRQAPSPQHAPRRRPDAAGNDVHRRRPDRPRKEPPRVVVETLRTADPRYSEDETDAARREDRDSDSERELMEPEEATAAQTTPTESPKPENKPRKLKLSPDEHDGDGAERRPERERSVQDLEASAGDAPSVSLTNVETVGAPVQETSPVVE